MDLSNLSSKYRIISLSLRPIFNFVTVFSHLVAEIRDRGNEVDRIGQVDDRNENVGLTCSCD